MAALFLVAALLGCGGGEAADQAGNDAEAITDQVAEATGAEPADDATPCEILDDELIQAHFDVGDATIQRKPSEYSPHPLCTARWPRPGAAEIEERSQEEMIEYMRRKMQGEDVERPDSRTTNEVSLTLNKDRFDDPQQAVASFDSAMRILSEGMTVSTDQGETTTPTYDMEPVDGVGRKAMWVPRLHQLSVVTDETIFHVGVRSEEGQEQAQAVAVARDLVGRL